MSRSELTGESAVDLVLRELKYQSVIQNSSKITYDPRNTKFVQNTLTRDEQLTILRSLRDRNEIGLIIETASSDFSNDFIGAEPHSLSFYLVDVSETDFKKLEATEAEAGYLLTVEFNSMSGVLYLSVNGEREQLGKLSHGSKAYVILERTFTGGLGVTHTNVDIFGEGSTKTNITQILLSNRLKWLSHFLEQSDLPRKITLNRTTIKVDSTHFKEIIMQINAKYRSKFQKYL